MVSRARIRSAAAFDYEFLRSYGLRNYQEGIQQRTFGSGRYLVNYAFKPAPALPGEVDTRPVSSDGCA